MKNIPLLLVLLFCFVPAVVAQQCPVSIPVSILADDNPVAGLSPSDFHVKIGAKPIAVLSASVVKPKRLILVLDTSGSMQGRPLFVDRQPWAADLDIAQEFVKATPEGIQITLLTLDKPIDVAVSDPDRNMLAKQIAAMPPPRGRTPLLDGLHRVITSLASSETGQVVVLISDGGENASKESLEHLKAELVEKGVRLFAIVPTTLMSTGEEHLGFLAIKDLTELSGGGLIRFDSDSVALQHRERQHQENVRIAKSMIRMTEAAYLLQFSGAGVSERAKVKVKLVKKTGRTGKLMLLHPRSVRPCR